METGHLDPITGQQTPDPPCPIGAITGLVDPVHLGHHLLIAQAETGRVLRA